MAIMADIVLQDAATPTPANHTYKPVALTGNKGQYRELSVDKFVNQSWIDVDLTPASATSAGNRSQWKLTMPHPLSEDDGCCSVGVATPTSWASVQIFANKLASRQQKLDLLAELADLVKDSQFIATVLGEGLR